MHRRTFLADCIIGSAALATAADLGEFDVVVFGGVPCGIAAAIAAARAGM